MLLREEELFLGRKRYDKWQPVRKPARSDVCPLVIEKQPMGIIALQTLQNQDDSASVFEDLVRRYETQIYRVAYRMTGNHEDAQDLVQ